MHTCSVAEYIIISRVSKIVKNLGYETRLNKMFSNVSVDCKKTREEIVLMQVKLKDILELVFPGIQIDKFMDVRLNFPDPHIMPIMLAQIPMDNKIYSMAVVITPESVLAVTPFKTNPILLREEGDSSGYTFEIFPTHIISDPTVNRRDILDELCASFTSILNVTNFVRPSVDDVVSSIKEKLTRMVLLPISSNLDYLYEKFGHITMEEVEVISSESELFIHIKDEVYVDPIMANTKAIDIPNPETISDPIKLVDFMPIALAETDDRFVFVRKRVADDNYNEKYTYNVHLKSHDSVGYHTNVADNSYDSLIIRSDDTTNYVVYLLPNAYYTYGNSISFVNDSFVEEHTISVVDAYDDIREGCESIAEEALKDVVKAPINYAKAGAKATGKYLKSGARKTADFSKAGAKAVMKGGKKVADTSKSAYATVSNNEHVKKTGNFITDNGTKLFAKLTNISKKTALTLGKISKPLADKVTDDLASIVRSGNQQKQKYVEQYTERMLNDELDTIVEKLGQWTKISIKSFAYAPLALVVAGPSVALGSYMITWFLLKKYDNKRRQQAIKEVELRVVSNIELLNDKIAAARAENDLEEVAELRKEKYMYDSALSQLVRMRTERYNDSLIDRIFKVKKKAFTVKSSSDIKDSDSGGIVY